MQASLPRSCVPSPILRAVHSKAELDPWFLEVHRTASSVWQQSTVAGTTDAAAAVAAEVSSARLPAGAPPAGVPVAALPSVVGMCLPGAAIPLRALSPMVGPLSTAAGAAIPELPPILIADASILDQHYNVLFAAEIIADNGGSSTLAVADTVASSASGSTTSAQVEVRTAASRSRDGSSSPLLPGKQMRKRAVTHRHVPAPVLTLCCACTGRYIFVIESLPSKCKSLWKYAAPAAAAFAALHGMGPPDSRAVTTPQLAPGGSAGLGSSGSSSWDLDSCKQCQGPVWQEGGGIHLHISTQPFRELEDYERGEDNATSVAFSSGIGH
jgi:hypothetical protein